MHRPLSKSYFATDSAIGEKCLLKISAARKNALFTCLSDVRRHHISIKSDHPEDNLVIDLTTRIVGHVTPRMGFEQRHFLALWLMLDAHYKVPVCP